MPAATITKSVHEFRGPNIDQPSSNSTSMALRACSQDTTAGSVHDYSKGQSLPAIAWGDDEYRDVGSSSRLVASSGRVRVRPAANQGVPCQELVT